ncbi:MAG: PAS domain-containing protein [Planctomycetota bacterium]
MNDPAPDPAPSIPGLGALFGEELTRAVLDNVPGGVVVVSRAGEILWGNAEGTRLLGFSYDQLSGRYLSEWDPQTCWEDGSPCPVEDYPVSRCLATGRRQGPVTIGVRRPGEGMLWAVFTAQPLRAPDSGELVGAAVTFLDVTSRREVEAALRASEERLRLLVEHVNDIIILVDREARIVYINRIAVGFSRDAVIGSSVEDNVPPEFREISLAAVAAALEGRESRHESQANDGRWYSSEVLPFERDAEGEVRTILFVCADVTERRRTEAERRQLQEDLARRVDDLSMLAGGVAHDFNNLLVGILGNADLALRQLPERAPVRGYLEDLRTAGQHAAELTRQLLAYSGRGRLTLSSVDLGALATGMLRLLQANVSRKASVGVEPAAALPAVEADETQLRQVVMNLVSNASDALVGGAGRIVVRTGVLDAKRARASSVIPLEGEAPAGFVFVEVQDDGCGMEPEVLPRVFDPFFTTKKRGRGLGMAGVLGIVRAHGGGIALESERGRGTRVRVLLPAQGSAPAEQPRAALEAPTPPPAPSRTVLVVDDEDIVRRLCCKVLESAGYRVLAAEGGRAALALVARATPPPDLVLCDLLMPDLDGIEVLETLAVELPAAALVLMTGYGDDTQIPARLRARLQPVLEKPFSASGLLGAAAQALAR